jgi:hypothetical protein
MRITEYGRRLRELLKELRADPAGIAKRLFPKDGPCSTSLAERNECHAA